jgi:hypothetical protein
VWSRLHARACAVEFVLRGSRYAVVQSLRLRSCDRSCAKVKQRLAQGLALACARARAFKSSRSCSLSTLYVLLPVHPSRLLAYVRVRRSWCALVRSLDAIFVRSSSSQ